MTGKLHRKSDYDSKVRLSPRKKKQSRYNNESINVKQSKTKSKHKTSHNSTSRKYRNSKKKLTIAKRKSKLVKYDKTNGYVDRLNDGDFQLNPLFNYDCYDECISSYYGPHHICNCYYCSRKRKTYSNMKLIPLYYHNNPDLKSFYDKQIKHYYYFTNFKLFQKQTNEKDFHMFLYIKLIKCILIQVGLPYETIDYIIQLIEYNYINILDILNGKRIKTIINGLPDYAKYFEYYTYIDEHPDNNLNDYDYSYGPYFNSDSDSDENYAFLDYLDY